MILILDSPNCSTQPLYHCVSNLIESKPSYTYEARPANYDFPTSEEADKMILAYAQKSFSTDWDLTDEEENNYWNNF